MDQLESVKETDHNGFCFEVTHKILEIPRDVYLENVTEFENPFSELAAQRFTESYLDSKKDMGVVGLVRIHDDKSKDQVVLEAAVRYVVDCKN